MFEFYDNSDGRTLTEQEATNIALEYLRSINPEATHALYSPDSRCSLLFDLDGCIYIEDCCGNHIEVGKNSNIGIRMKP